MLEEIIEQESENTEPILASEGATEQNSVNPVDTEQVSSEQEEVEFSLFGNEAKESSDTEQDSPITTSTSRDYSKFKEFFDDEEDEIDSDEKLVERLKKLSGKAKAQEIINTANERFYNNDTVKSFIELLEQDNDDLLILAYQNEGYTEDDAKDKVADLKDRDPREYRAKSTLIRKSLNEKINEIKTNIRKEVEEAAETLKSFSPKDVDTKVLKEAAKEVTKLQTFAGLNLGVSEKDREAFFKPIVAMIESGEILKQIRSNPQAVAEFAFYLKNKEQITKAIENRFYPKRKFVDGLDKAPHSGGMAKPLARRNNGEKSTVTYTPSEW